jgi:hypothetical protein
LAKPIVRVDVDIEHALEPRAVHVRELQRRRDDAGVDHHAIEAAEPRFSGAEHRNDIGLHGDIALQSDCVAAGGANLAGGFLGRGPVAEVSERDTPPFARAFERCGAADAACAAGDKNGFHQYLCAAGSRIILRCASNTYRTCAIGDACRRRRSGQEFLRAHLGHNRDAEARPSREARRMLV